MSGEDETKARLDQAELEATNDLRRAIYSQEASAIRAPQVVNAGGAVALLAFLGQTWVAAPELRIAVATSIGLMVLGLLLAIWGEFQLPEFSERRYRQSQSSDALRKYRKARQRRRQTVCLSFLSFALAVVILLAWAAGANSLWAKACGLSTG
jgi:hypothetical protein